MTFKSPSISVTKAGHGSPGGRAPAPPAPAPPLAAAALSAAACAAAALRSSSRLLRRAVTSSSACGVRRGRSGGGPAADSVLETWVLTSSTDNDQDPLHLLLSHSAATHVDIIFCSGLCCRSVHMQQHIAQTALLSCTNIKGWWVSKTWEVLNTPNSLPKPPA